MPECPRCRQAVDTRVINCPFCQAPLKAYGHPGIPLYRATGEASLCQTCVYDADNTCTFPQRPHARECTLYSDRTQPKAAPAAYNRGFLVRGWLKRNLVWLVLVGLVLLSVAITFLR